MKKWFAVGLLMVPTWIMVRAPELSSIPGELLNGALIGFGTAFLLRRMYEGETSAGSVSSKIPAMTKYVELFAWELLTANIDVAKRVLSPSLPIAPEVVEYKLDIETEPAITTLANSITLTPGTLTLDHDEEEEKLIIHAIDGAEHPEEVKKPIRRWENLLKKIEGERE